jgi:Ion channel
MTTESPEPPPNPEAEVRALRNTVARLEKSRAALEAMWDQQTASRPQDDLSTGSTRRSRGAEVFAPRAGRIEGLGRLYFQRRYAVLFYSLLLTLVASPLAAALKTDGRIIELFVAANLMAAILPVSTGRGRRILLLIMTMLWAARLATAWLHHPALEFVTIGLGTGLGLFAAAGALRFVMRSRFVHAEQLYAALSAYLLAGIVMGLFYWAVEQIWPSTFVTTGAFTRASAIYFSFVTLATLGYGDIVPRGDVARGLAVIEGIGGQLFLAVLVARLVSSYGRGQDAAD